MMSIFKNFIKIRRGQTIVEFVLVLPIFIILVFAIIEYSRLWETVNVLTSAAREAARVAVVTAPDIQQATNAAQNILSAGNIQNATVTISGPNALQDVLVTVSMNYSPITGSIVPGVGSISLTRTATMRWEG